MPFKVTVFSDNGVVNTLVFTDKQQIPKLEQKIEDGKQTGDLIFYRTPFEYGTIHPRNVVSLTIDELSVEEIRTELEIRPPEEE